MFSISACLCVTCVTVEPPRQNDVQPPAPSSSSSQAPPAPGSSRYRERRSRRAHRGGGTRDDRYRSGQRQHEKPSTVRVETSVRNTSDALIAEEALFNTSSDAPFSFLGQLAPKFTQRTDSKGPIKELCVCVCGLKKITVKAWSRASPSMRTPAL